MQCTCGPSSSTVGWSSTVGFSPRHLRPSILMQIMHLQAGSGHPRELQLRAVSQDTGLSLRYLLTISPRGKAPQQWVCKNFWTRVMGVHSCQGKSRIAKTWKDQSEKGAKAATRPGKVKQRWFCGNSTISRLQAGWTLLFQMQDQLMQELKQCYQPAMHYNCTNAWLHLICK